MEAYFDNSATTRCFEEVKDIVVKTMMEDFGNPSAMHQKGVDAEGYVKESARTLAQILKVTEKEILFTSGGTESNNLALIGGALANKRSGNHIITTAVEHAAVSQPVAFLQEQGFEVTILPVDGHGVVKLDALEKALRPDTILVSTMMVNNETGAVMPVEKIGAMIQEKCPKALYHVDAIQAFGKYRIYPKKWNIHLLSVSSHKIHGPKGVGFLYINSKAKVQPLIRGGGRQRPSVLADAVEAMLAAIYLDGGIRAAKGFILDYIKEKAEKVLRTRHPLDYKTALQEIVQKNREETLTYRLKGETGPDHDKRFIIELLINSNVIAEGVGRSKKEAEQEAARLALELMGQ